MSWIDQGRQEHGWFGHGTAPRVDSGEFGARAFAAVQFAADEFPSRDRLPFPLEKTMQVLRAFASIMAPEAGLAPNAFRLRFFRESFDPVDAWAIQLIMRDMEAADTHAGLVRSGRHLAAAIREYGPNGWAQLLGTAVAQFAPPLPAEAAGGDVGVQKAQYAVPAGPFPLLPPPAAFPGTRENRALTDATIKGLRALGSALGGLLESRRHDEDDDEDEDRRRRPPRAQPSKPAGVAGQDGDVRDKPPRGSRPIDQTPWSGDHDPIKKGINAGPKDDVRISPNDDVWLKNPDGTWTNRGAAGDFTGSGEPSGRTGKERDRRPGS